MSVEVPQKTTLCQAFSKGRFQEKFESRPDRD
jgi:hypothetical protein